MKIYLGLGSNLGNRENHLRTAVASIARNRIQVIRSASIYLTEPRDFAAQPWFLNTVLEADTELTPLELLEQCLEIERDAGRVRTMTKGPREIDIDILFYGNCVVETSELTVPHSQYAFRRFVLAPLMEIAPGIVDPKLGVLVRVLFDALSDRSAVTIYGPPLF